MLNDIEEKCNSNVLYDVQRDSPLPIHKHIKMTDNNISFEISYKIRKCWGTTMFSICRQYMMIYHSNHILNSIGNEQLMRNRIS